MLETTQTEQTDMASDSPRYVVGRYRVHVEAMLPDGLAHGRIVEIIEPPDAAAYAAVYGAGRTVETPTEFTFIGGLPGETVEVEARWNLPRPGRKRAKRDPRHRRMLSRSSRPRQIAPRRAVPSLVSVAAASFSTWTTRRNCLEARAGSGCATRRRVR